MADIVTARKLHDGLRYCEYEFTNESDSTGESAVKKIDLTDLIGDNGYLTGGRRPTSLSLMEADWEVFGFNYVTAYWDRSPSNIAIVTMSGDGGVDHSKTGGKHDPNRGMDGTGDILFTIDSATDGDSYRIRMKFKKKYV